MRGLSEFGLALDFLVQEYAGAKGQMPPRQRRKNCVYIATIEKANSLISSLTEDGRLDSIGLVVVDEVRLPFYTTHGVVSFICHFTAVKHICCRYIV